MDKLIELLNEFEKEKESGFTWRSIDSYDNCVYGVDCDGETEITMYSDLYSKWYGFIKWLVDNDKIDFEKAKGFKLLPLDTAFWFRLGDNEKESLNRLAYYKLLMILSIQDNPIEFLVSILK